MRDLSHEINVIRPSQLEIKGSGVFDMEHDNYIEHKIAKLGLLEKLIKATMDQLSECGENNVVLGAELEALSERAYEEYEHFIQTGTNIFALHDCFIQKTLNNYKVRPIVNGYTNAGPNDRTEGLPDGWWWNYPSYAEKMFEDSYIIVGSIDGYIRVDRVVPEPNVDCGYEPDFSIECSDYEGLYEHEIYERFPEEQAKEICVVVAFCKEVL